METEKFNSIYESARVLTLNTDPITKEIETIRDSRLKSKLLEILQNVQGELMYLTDVCFQCSLTETPEELQDILDTMEPEQDGVIN